MKTIINKTALFFSLLILAICGSVAAANASTPAQAATPQPKTIILGTHGADADIWRFIAQSAAAKQVGLKIEVKEINDGIVLNNATAAQQVDVNAFQSWAYYKTFNRTHGDKLAAIATTYLEPMGLYSKKHSQLTQLPKGAVIAIPNDTANTARALLLLEYAGLIILKSDFDPIMGMLPDIIGNHKGFVIKLIDGASGPRVLADVDLVAIGNTYALESGLNVIADALIHEGVGTRVVNNINLLVVSKQRATDPELQKLAALYHQPAVDAYIKEHFGGTKLAVNQPISSLEDETTRQKTKVVKQK